MKAAARTLLVALESKVIGRSVSAACILLAIAGLAWSFAARLPAIERLREERRKLFLAQNQLQDAQGALERARKELAREKALFAAMLFNSEAEAKTWLDSFLTNREQDALKIVPEWEARRSASPPFEGLADFREVSLNITMEPSEESDPSGYIALARLLKALSENTKHLDIRELTVSGSGQGITAARVRINCWLRKDS